MENKDIPKRAVSATKSVESSSSQEAANQMRHGSYCGRNGHLLLRKQSTQNQFAFSESRASVPNVTSIISGVLRKSSISRVVPDNKNVKQNFVISEDEEEKKDDYLSKVNESFNSAVIDNVKLWDTAYEKVRQKKNEIAFENLKADYLRKTEHVTTTDDENQNFLRKWGSRIKEAIGDIVILPHYGFAKYWELFIIFCVFWNSVFLPYNLAFSKDFQGDPSLLVTFVNNFTDVCFIIDLFLNFFTAYVDQWGTLITVKRDIAQNYLSKWFWVDLPACLPFDLFVPRSQATAINMVKCIRLMRIAKIFKFMERFRFANSMRILRLFISLVLICHWIGCLWYFIGVTSGVNCEEWPGYFDVEENIVLIGDEWKFIGMPIIDYNNGTAPAFCSWLSLNRLADQPTKTKYIRSLYWAVTTVTSVGYGDIVPITNEETLFAILIMLLGAGIYAMIFSNFVSYVSRMDGSERKYSEKMEEIRTQMRYLQLPANTQERIEQYFEYIWLCHKGLLDKENYFFEDLPPPLRLECSGYLHTDMLKGTQLFKGCSDSFIRGCVLRLRPQIVVPQVYIVNKGDSANAIFFISRGNVDLHRDYEGDILGRLGPGDYFGDVAVLSSKRRTASVKAVHFCDLHYLLAEDLRGLLRVYSPDAEKIAENTLEFINPQYQKGAGKKFKLRILSNIEDSSGSVVYSG